MLSGGLWTGDEKNMMDMPVGAEDFDFDIDKIPVAPFTNMI